jgi:hypothetical protein
LLEILASMLLEHVALERDYPNYGHILN